MPLCNYSLTPEKVIDDISIYKNLEDCPKMNLVLENDVQNLMYKKVNFTLTKPSQRHGQCCHAIVPEEATKFLLQKMHIRAKIENRTRSKFRGFQVFLLSQEASHLYKINNFHNRGYTKSLKIDEKDYSCSWWKVRIHQEYLLEEDPKTHCKNYHKIKGYSKVKDIVFYSIKFNCKLFSVLIKNT